MNGHRSGPHGVTGDERLQAMRDSPKPFVPKEIEASISFAMSTKDSGKL
jgi:hypothetical protein